MDPDHLPLLFIGVGALFVLLGVRQAASLRRFRATAQRVPGVVVDLQHDSSGDGAGIWYPILDFRTVDGRPVRTRAMYGRSPAPARRGDHVQVLYDPADPRRASLPGGGAALLPVVLVVLGTIALLVGLGATTALGLAPDLLPGPPR